MKNAPRNLLFLLCDVLQQLPRPITTPFSSGVRTVCAVLRCTPGTRIFWVFFKRGSNRLHNGFWTLRARCSKKNWFFFSLGFSLKVVYFCIWHFFSVTLRYGGPGWDGRTDFGCFVPSVQGGHTWSSPWRYRLYNRPSSPCTLMSELSILCLGWMLRGEKW